ncbi:hypothetical protein [Kutzneria sp. CA-103260]|uniref:hypothetical protein n=1 Tax=Kutzneria sp. CA-103260 TaxID=2802641 RepID=UPI001BAB32B5|nr:hypothetical protein [Kutzneria sp. CA-103260]QUQ64625.1 hypothetical protein JJ691_23460 [Kutzneria sp. CA-103260]
MATEVVWRGSTGKPLDAVGSSAEVRAVSRWSEPEVHASLEARDVLTHSAEIGDPADVRGACATGPACSSWRR